VLQQQLNSARLKLPHPVVARYTLFHVIAGQPVHLFFRFIPAPILLKTWLFVRYVPGDVLDKLTGHTDPLIPPRRKDFTGGSAFREIGDDFFAYFRDYGGIAPHHRILDIGSGIGRMARPLTAFLDPVKGRYEGFDIDARGVLWCSQHYVSHPNFHFQRANIYNKLYNPWGTVQAQAFTFPYPDASFDFAFASSVFTHMPPPAVAHYLRETARVLAPGARALLTLFLWNQESAASVAQGKSSLPFRPHGDLIVINPDVPEAAIALPQEGWDQAVRDAGLEQVGDVLWGNWCGRTPFTSYQDIVIVRKPG
jgi:SAM-dependent methyltransferase